MTDEQSERAPVTATAPFAAPWRRIYARRLWISDLLVLIWVVYGTQIAWFGLGAADLAISSGRVAGEISYWSFSTALILVWMLTLSLADTRDHRVIGAGSAEYARIAQSSVTLFGVIAIIAFLTQTEVARGFLLISLPLGILVLLFERWLWRQWLIAQRRTGAYSARVLLVGSRRSVVETANELLRNKSAGYHLVGACVPTGAIAETIDGTDIPIMGSISAVTSALAACNADTVIVTSTDELPVDKVKEISWQLEPGRQHLVLAPGIADIAGPRIHTRPVAGLPLIHVETPRFGKGQKIAKRAFDICASLALIIALSPVLAGVALLVRMSSPGPILYRQQRIGRAGEPFHMLKFRSMRVGADQELRALLEAQGTSEKPLFKIHNDPRITPIGRILRKYSLDELPQLFNVLGGSMSIVGPRPQIAAEVALYTDAAKRRLLARPGITGLWQVSGRSTMEWDDAVRLDLYYVENWSLVNDLLILVKTVRAVVQPGASAH
ncbi:sugar transferase [Microbacterium oleivorans]|uniref:Polyprenyl glycosylphosphotransferase n=1 Tax=Microbacterium oleivorans TaxID=273677 RepID=A0A177KA99_9MICO|nr:sugar transferase [Microbacterium oleivorans]OAH49511.1 polyprenyl glycosylphosphotransferase [Microbacterium oleivorans]